MRTRSLLALLLLIPLVDAFVLVAIVGSGILTALQTVALVVLTGLLGMILVRAEGRNTLMRFQQKAAAGSPPTDELLDGGLLIAAGAFLLTPGLVTDLIGFLLVLPPTRYPIRVALKRWVIVPYIDKQTGGFGTGNVWTFGFPDPDGAGDGDGNPFGPGGFDGGPGAGAGGPSGTGGPSVDDTAGGQAGGSDDEEYVDVDFEVTDDGDSRSES
ncbi:membrane protein FxsA [Halonotius terrestris]|uniref:Membrane protein FxsA n=1 Tax=Halonotius terrestris TaxID=2487750 RepID=A0A8J8PDF1_9EURY|nr:FxsA family protein [Halonotius terrestris]TQQ83280.1 membrane protein FxsA [Halonotius terrestris]